jgi:tetratricopeptide (TPR) repeat protein
VEALIAQSVSAPEPEFAAIPEPEPAAKLPVGNRIGTSELMESFLSGIDASFSDAAPAYQADQAASDVLDSEEVAETVSIDPTAFGFEAIPEAASEASPVAYQPQSSGVETELQQMLEDLKGNTGDLPQAIDYETHFNLGLAYKDMDLLDEAIEQFQMAFRLAAIGDNDASNIQCCHMLGVCFKLKLMPKVAVMWFERGLKVQNRGEDEYQALRYEIGLCHEELGDVGRAIDFFMEVFGVDVNYRSVGEKIRELQAVKNA